MRDVFGSRVFSIRFYKYYFRERRRRAKGAKKEGHNKKENCLLLFHT